jgi:hypothetical protein
MVVADSAVMSGTGAAAASAARRPGARLTSPTAANPNVHLFIFINQFLLHVVVDSF